SRTRATPTPATPASSAAAATQGPTTPMVHSFVSRSDLQPPMLSVSVLGSPYGIPPYMFLGNKPYKGTVVGQEGLLIARRDGDIAWFSPITKGQVLDFNVHSYQGKPVLTWWHGSTGASYGQGTCYIADSSYSLIATIKGGNGLMPDMHEFNLTDQGTALVDAYRVHTADLSPLGGKSKGTIVSGVVQEIDVATGDIVFEWDSFDHVPVTETKDAFFGGTPANPFDYFHINSIAVAPDGNLLVSSRHTWTVYKIGRRDGQIRWRLGGKKSDFTIGAGAGFEWQHHVRAHGSDLLTVFDNASSPPEEAQSRGLILRLDTQNMQATLVRAFTNPAGGLLADNQGSMQLLPGNRAFVGWGAQPYFDEFDADGSVLLSGHLPIGDQSYRTFTGDWTGRPKDKPAIVVSPNPARGVAAYVSWNGATEVASWRLHAGKRESALDVVAALPKSGFETVIPANSTGPYFAVTAHDSSGAVVGQSAIVRNS
ncbi:MAG: arylsulfotransferase family protein, partial [Streptosporangiaceae bacterium]